MKSIELSEVCKKCGFAYGIILENGPHLELVCHGCNSHIQFVPKKELEKNNWEIYVANPERQPSLREIDFKLDLILDRLEVVCK